MAQQGLQQVAHGLQVVHAPRLHLHHVVGQLLEIHGVRDDALALVLLKRRVVLNARRAGHHAFGQGRGGHERVLPDGGQHVAALCHERGQGGVRARETAGAGDGGQVRRAGRPPAAVVQQPPPGVVPFLHDVVDACVPHVRRERIGRERGVIHLPWAVGIEVPGEKPLGGPVGCQLVHGRELEAGVLPAARGVQRPVARRPRHVQGLTAPPRDALHRTRRATQVVALFGTADFILLPKQTFQ
mmetsp:Transcript_3369/g.7892  ORF Transcript_3369/g.7892 Transcript_3369/m.7892 type:complete len:242 (-) Transcript_3369:399-1124(-)